VGRRREKLWISFAPVERKLTMSDSDWQRIEGAFQNPMLPAVREAVFKVTQRFLNLEKFERAAQSVSEAVSRVDPGLLVSCPERSLQASH
jgi:hypothetical protein